MVTYSCSGSLIYHEVVNQGNNNKYYKHNGDDEPYENNDCI